MVHARRVVVDALAYWSEQVEVGCFPDTSHDLATFCAHIRYF